MSYVDRTPERVPLVVCLALAIPLMGYGVWEAFGDSLRRGVTSLIVSTLLLGLALWWRLRTAKS